MPISFPIYSYDLGSKILQGLQAGQQMKEQATRQQYLGDTLKEQLAQLQAQTPLAQELAKYAPQLASAQVAQAQALPEHMRAQTKDILEGQLPLQQQQAKYYGPNIESEIASRQADIPYKQALMKEMLFKQQNPLLSQSGLAGQIGAMLFLQQHPDLNRGFSGSTLGASVSAPSIGTEKGGQPSSQKSLSDILIGGIGRQQHAQESRANYFDKMNQAYAYRLLPQDQKAGLVAQASGMGYDPVQASTLFIQGHSINDLAKAKGFEPENMPDAIYPAGPRARAQIQQRQQALAEVNTINPILENAIAPYSRRIAGYSPKQIAEALTGSNEDSQAKFLAAMGMQPEMAGMRFRAMSGQQLGVEAIRDIVKASMGHIRQMQSLVSPQVYKRAQEYMDNWISQGIESANKANLRAFSQAAQAKPETKFSEEDIQHTMKKHRMTREQVLQKLNQKFGGQSNVIGNQDTQLQDQLGQISQQLEALQAQQGGEVY